MAQSQVEQSSADGGGEASASPGSGPAVKRRRITKACDNCRRRRSRCDGSEPSCGVCKALDIKCTYNEQQKRRGPPKGTKRSLSKRETSAQPGHDQGSTSGLPNNSLAPPVSEQYPSLHDAFAYTTRKGLHYRGSSSGYALLASPDAKALELGDNANLVRIDDSGSSSPRSDTDYDDEEDEDDPVAMTATISIALLTAFFDDVYPSWPCVFPFAYEAQTSVALLEELHPSLLASMQALAWGSVHQKYPDIALPSQAWFIKTAWQQLSARWPIQRNMTTVQSLTLLSLASYGSGDFSTAWTMCSMACAISQDMGIHRKLPRLDRADGAAIEREVRARTFWNVYMLDIVLALELGRTPLIRAADCDAPMPSWEVDYPFPRFGTTSFETLHIVPVINATFRACIIAEEIIEAFYSLSGQQNMTKNVEKCRQEAKRIIKEQDILVSAFERETCPIPVDSTSGATPTANLIVFSMGLSVNTITLHRAFLGHKAAFDDHLKLVSQAAIDLVEQLHLAGQRSFSSLAEILYLAFTAAVSFISILRQHRQDLQDAANRGLNDCISWLEQREAGWPAAHAAGKLLRDAREALSTLPASSGVANGSTETSGAATMFDAMADWNVEQLLTALSLPEDFGF